MKRKQFSTILAMVVVFGLLASHAVMARTWTQANTGRTIDAELVSVQGDSVVLKLPKSKQVMIPVESLSTADQDCVRSAVASSPRSELIAPVAGGQQRWQVNVGQYRSDWKFGYGASQVLADDLVAVAFDSKGKGFLAAYD